MKPGCNAEGGNPFSDKHWHIGPHLNSSKVRSDKYVAVMKNLSKSKEISEKLLKCFLDEAFSCTHKPRSISQEDLSQVRLEPVFIFPGASNIIQLYDPLNVYL